MTTTTTSHADALRARAARRTDSYGESIWYTIHELRQHHPEPIYFGDGAPAPEAGSERAPTGRTSHQRVSAQLGQRL